MQPHPDDFPTISPIEADALFRRIVGGFLDASRLRWEFVSPFDIPSPARELLVHNGHMTTVLELHHRCKAALEVLSEAVDAKSYRRMILLRDGNNDVIEFGVVNVDLAEMPSSVTEEIRAKRMPLGEILIRHNVHRVVSPKAFLRLEISRQELGTPPSTFFGYGRLGVIHCNGSAAVEMLEATPLLPSGGMAVGA